MNENSNSKSGLSFSMVTFAYNEEALLENQIRIWARLLEKFADDYEIILVNDGSSDRTGEIADSLALQYPKLKVIHHERNLGIGYAVREGLSHVAKDIVFWNDIDAHFNLEDLEKVIPLLKDPEVDIVAAFKHDMLRTKSPLSWFKSRVNYYLIKSLFFSLILDFSPILDFQFVQFYPRKFFTEGIHLESYSSFIPAECLIKARKIGLNIRQIQLRYHTRFDPNHPRSGFSMRTILTSVRNIMEFWLRWKFLGGRRRAVARWKSAFGDGASLRA
ncbi:MAG TPA: glycosyltransferase family 2 protein [bacterium]|nr:glycosyltransferase family 2 protein [bacterium]